MTDSARSQLYEVKVADYVVLGVVEDDDSWFAVELHSDESAIRIRRDLRRIACNQLQTKL